MPADLDERKPPTDLAKWEPPPEGGGPPEGMILGAVHVLDNVGPIRKSRPQLVDTIVLLTVPVTALLVLVGIPVARTIWHGVPLLPPSTEGLWPAVIRTASWALIVPFATTGVGLILADILGQRVPKGRTTSLSGRVMFLLVIPLAVPLVVTGIAFRILLHPDPERGLMTRYLEFIPLDNMWLGPRSITISLMLAFGWAWLGLATVILRTTLDRMRDILVTTVTIDRQPRTIHIYPVEIESALRRYGAVRDCALEVSEDRTHIDKALIVLKEDEGFEPAYDPDIKDSQDRVITPEKLHAYLGQLGNPVASFRPQTENYRFVKKLPPVDRTPSVPTLRFWQWAFYRRYWSAGLGWVAIVVFLLIAMMTSRTLDLILTMAPGATVGDASVLSVLHWQSRDATSEQEALGALWLIGVAVLAFGCLLVLRVTRCQRPRWPHLRFSNPRPDDQASERRKKAPAERKLRRTPRGKGRRGPARASMGRHAVFVASTGVWMFPLLALLMTSLHSRTEAATTAWWEPSSWWPPTTELSFESWTFDVAARGAMLRTALVALLAAIAVAFLASFVVKAMEGMSSLGEGVILLLVIGLALIPPQVVGVHANSMFGSAPGDPSAWQQLLVVHVALTIPLAVLIFYNTGADWLGSMWNEGQVRMQGIGGRPSLLKQTWVVATTPWRTMRRRQPTVVAVAVLVFIQVWNDFVIGVLVGQDAIPLTVHLSGQTRQFVSNSGPLAAASLLAAIVPVALLLFTATRLVEGLVGRDRNQR